MITILKGKEITVEWKVMSLDTKQPVDFEGVNAKVFLLAPDNIYTLPFDVVRDDFRGLRMTIPTSYISTGVYDLKVIWLKDALKDKPVYRNVSVKREVFALTDEASEVTYDGDTIKIATGVESCGRDGLSAYEIAVFRGFAKESSEKEWVESLDDVLASEASRVEAEIKRKEEEYKRANAEHLRIQIFTKNEEDRRQSFVISQSNRDSDFQNFLYDKELSYIKAENNRDSAYYNRELLRDGRFETEERERNTTFIHNEQNRNKAEEGRSKAEEDRKSTFEENEANRQSTFQSNEDRREEKETLRGIEEEKRNHAETIRQENETKRVDAETLRQDAESIREATYKNKVDRDDYAPKLTAGLADNLVGRGEATEEEITFRPTAGDVSIGAGVAHIDRVKGSTVVWNQFAPVDLSTYHLLCGTNRTYADGVLTFTANTANSTSYIYKSESDIVPSRLGCIVYGFVEIKSESTNANVFIIGVGTSKYFPATGDWQKIETFGKVSLWSGAVIGAGVSVKDELVTCGIRQLKYYDLTQMFGAGNEPTTIEEFHARKPINIDEYAYNEGELISNNVEEVKSVGFNAWDEEWEYGDIGVNGENISSTTTIRSKNYIPLTPNQTYRADYPNYSTTYMELKLYDKNNNLINNRTLGGGNGQNFNSGNDYAYARFTFPKSSYSTICFHLVHTGIRNGEYEPYKEFRRSIPIKDIKDKDGNQLFPLGLLSAGSAYDEITTTKAIKRVGVLPLSDISFSRTTESKYYFTMGLIVANNAVNTLTNITCSHYLTKSWTGNKGFTSEYTGERKPCLALWRTNAGLDRVNILDDSMANVSELTAMLKEKNVMLYYELAEPIEVDLEEPLNFDYDVDDFGTEEIISSEPTTPLKADIVYQFNAVDRIRDNSRHTAEADKKLADYEARIASLEAIVASLTSNEL